MTQNILLLNPTSDARITSDFLGSFAQAMTAVTNRHFAPAWGVTAFVTCTGKETDVSGWPLKFLPTLDDAEAVAYHTKDLHGRPALVVGLDVIFDNGGSASDGPLSASVAAGHEIYEALIDPPCSIWSDMADGVREVAYEVVDPAQGDCYDEGGISVPNFVFPSWFDVGVVAGTKIDQMGRIGVPLGLGTGGYMVTRTGGPNGTSQEVFGEAMPDFMKLYKHRHNRRVRAAHRRFGLLANPLASPFENTTDDDTKKVVL